MALSTSMIDCVHHNAAAPQPADQVSTSQPNPQRDHAHDLPAIHREGC